MALSQVKCLDENNVNPRTHEAKPEFLYCENQRLALEVLIRDGREAFRDFLKARELRGFLSDPEMDFLTGSAKPYDPGSDVLRSESDGEDLATLSEQYWPDLSDTSVPELDLGWPDTASYRGVTRTNVYAQPPLDGQAHIKEVVRKAIAQAQKMIAIAMDIFTDVDIFRDLLDAGHKRKVSVYILLERSTIPHFLSMCDRANMHRGHLKNLRVRCGGGEDFLTRSCSRLRGRLGHRFMFIDGDRALSGSYCYTWMSSRLDRHLITVVTGQAVDSFDRLFRELYAISSAVDLQQVSMVMEPEPEPVSKPVAVAATSADVARKLHNPMYALLAYGTNPAPPSSSNTPKEMQGKAGMVSMKDKGKMAKMAEPPPIHPGLVDLEKAYLIPYLPTWPEPDPASDVIGFINVRDNNRQMQVHMQRSERFETSQAIRFSSPFSKPKETLPEVAQLRQQVDKAQPMSSYTGPSTLVTQPPGRDVHIVGDKSVDVKSEPKVKAEKQHVNNEYKPSANTATQQITTPHSNPPTYFSNKAPIINPGAAVPTRPIHNLTINDPGQHLDIASKNHVGQSTPTKHTAKNIHSDHVSNSDHMPTLNPASSHVHASPSAIHQHNASLHVQTQNWTVQKVPGEPDLGINAPPLPCFTQSMSTLTPPLPKPRTVHLQMDSWSNVLNLPLDTEVVSEPGKLSGSGSVVDYCKPFVTGEQQEDAIMKRTRTQIGYNPVFNSTTKMSEWQDRGDMETYFQNEVKDGLSKEFPESKQATDQKTQSILTVNTLHADDKQFKGIMPKESGYTSQEGNMVKSSRVIVELSKPEKDSTSVTKPYFLKTTCVQTNEGLRQQHSQTHKASASEPPSSSHAPENNTVIDAKHIPKQNVDDTPGSRSVNVLDTISRVHTQGGQCGVTTHPSNDQAVNHVHDGLNSVKAKRDSLPEKPRHPHTLESCAPTAGRVSPCTPAPAWKNPNSRCHSRTPTPDMSDGYISSRDDSTLSTTSDEYYDCSESDSPRPSPVCDQGLGLDNSTTDNCFSDTPLPNRDDTRATSANADTVFFSSTKRDCDTSANTSISPLFVPHTQEYKAWGVADRADILAADEQSIRHSECLSQTVGRSVPPETLDVDGGPPPASGNKSMDIQSPTSPILQRMSSSSASSENTVSPFNTPVPSPSPTPTPKRAATNPRGPQPDREVSRSAVGSSRGGNGDGRQLFGNDRFQELPGEFPRRLEDHLLRAGQKDTDPYLGTSRRRSSGDLYSEITALRTSRAEVKRDPWVPRETEGNKGLLSPPGAPQGWSQQQNHHSQVSLQSPAAKLARPTRPFSFQLPKTSQHALQASSSSQVEQDSPQTLRNNSVLPRQPPQRRQSSMTATGSRKGQADQKSPEGSLQRSSAGFSYGQPGAGQGVGPFPKPQPSFLYTYTNTQSPPQPQTQPMAPGNQVAQTQSKYRHSSASGDLEPGDPGQGYTEPGSKTAFGVTIGKLYNLKVHRSKGSSSPSQSKRSLDPSVRKSTG